MKKMIVLGVCAMQMVITGRAEKIDILKPETQVKEQAVRRFIESHENKKIPYNIKIQKYKTSDPNQKSIKVIESDEYIITFPEEIQQQINKLDKQVLHDTFMDYFDDERYSFNMAVLMMAETVIQLPPLPPNVRRLADIAGFRPGIIPLDSMRVTFWIPEALIKKDRELWIKKLPQERNVFIDSYSKTFTNSKDVNKPYEIRSIKKDSYKHSVLLKSIPATYTNEIVNLKNCSVFATYFEDVNPKYRRKIQIAFTNETTNRISYSMQIKKLEFIQDFFNDTYPAFCYKNPKNTANFEKWHDIRKENTQKFINICRENDTAGKPYLSALMMGLFTVDGYSFNDETGVYTMNERGRMLMDFVVEFPIPENATRLQAVMNGGNKDEIEAMMKKHGTEEKWAEFLKNPVHPEFAKYAQE